MSYGIFVSKDGFAANDPGTELKNLTLDTTKEHFQFKRENADTVIFGSTGLQTIAHGLGFAPAFLAFIKRSGNSYWTAIYQSTGNFDAYVDSTNLYLYGQIGDKIRYYLFTKPIDPTITTPQVDYTGYGIMASAEGYDVRHTEEKNISYNSNWGSLMIYQEINLSVTVSVAGTQTNSQAHNMGYSPSFMATVYDGSTGDFFTEPYVFADGSDLLTGIVRMDSTNVTVEVNASALFVPITFSFRIHLFTEELEDS